MWRLRSSAWPPKKLEEEALRKDAEIRVLETNLQHQTETVERLEQEIRDADQTGATLEERLARLRQTIGDNDAAGADKRRQLEEITRQSQALLDSGDSNTKETTELNRKLSDLTLQLSDAKVQASAAASSMEEIGQRSGPWTTCWLPAARRPSESLPSSRRAGRIWCSCSSALMRTATRCPAIK